jgi:hypothetical protein
VLLTTLVIVTVVADAQTGRRIGTAERWTHEVQRR